jgi:hypothetical protein
MTTRALKSTALVVKSTLPAEAKAPSYVAFDDFVTLGERLKDCIEELELSTCRIARVCDALQKNKNNLTYAAPSEIERYASDIRCESAIEESDLAEVLDEIATFNTQLAYYEREQVRDAKGAAKRGVISDQVALLIGAVPNAKPHNVKTYTTMMVEEIAATRVGPIAFEMACRHIRRAGSSFAPSVPEMVKAIRAQRERWRAIAATVRNADVAKLNATLAAGREEAKRKLKEIEDKRERERIMNEMRRMRERAEREAKARVEPQAKLVKELRSLWWDVSRRFLWRYLDLLMLSHGIFVSRETLSKVWWERAEERQREFFASFVANGHV